MIIISAGAGLGNQMYEYAFYMKLRKKYPNVRICLDPDYAFVNAHNGYEIEKIFGVHSERASREDIFDIGDVAYFANYEAYNTLQSKFRRKLKLHKRSFLIQKDFTEFYPAFLSLDINRNWYLYGPFANYRYFEDIADSIRDEFVFPCVNIENRFLANKINNTESVSIHIRRGDYIKEGVETMTPEYVEKAIKILTDKIRKKEGDLDFFVFSDDLEYVRNVYGTRINYHIVSGNQGKNSFRDMQLMSMCKHNITANSTFSFWGAFLNANKDAVIICPRKPFKGCRYPFSCDDWIHI